MRAAITKIPHLLYEEVLLKIPRLIKDFIYNECGGNGRKTPKCIQNKGKIPRLVKSIKLEADCFPGRKDQKQAGPTLGGTGILIYRGKRNKGSGEVWVVTTR